MFQHCFESHKRTIVYSIFTAVMLCLPMAAQVTSGTISGRVQDSTGAVINNATVTITNPSNGFTRQLTTTDSGEFVAPNLLPGTYSVSVEAHRLQETGINRFCAECRGKTRYRHARVVGRRDHE